MPSNVKASRYVPFFEPTEFLRAAFTDFEYPWHVHETFAIGVIEAGAQRLGTRGGSELMPQSRLCVVDPDIAHDGRAASEAGWTYRMFYPSSRAVASALEIEPAKAETLAFGVFSIEDHELFHSFARLHDLAWDGDDPLLCDMLAVAFVRELFARHAGAVSSQDRACDRIARLCRDYMGAHFTEAMGLSDLAHAAGASPAHVARSFKAASGMSPFAFVIALRVDEAKRLIASGESLAEVSTACGFVDQSHMHRHFRRIVGVTPGVFVREIRR